MHPVVARAQQLRKAGDLDQAIAVLREALHDEPDNVELSLLAGIALFELGDARGAIPPLERAQGLVPDGQQARIAAALGAAYDAVGRHDDAIDACRAALRGDPMLVPPAVLLAMLLADRGQRDEALALLRSASTRAKPATRATIERAIAELETPAAR